MVTYAELYDRYSEAQTKDLLRRGLKVKAKAQLFLSGLGAGHPQRVRTGQLRSSIQVQLTLSLGGPRVRIGSGLRHARWVHDGTGIYGPYRRKITPKFKQALKFTANNQRFIVHSVKGMKANHYLKDALPAARD